MRSFLIAISHCLLRDVLRHELGLISAGAQHYVTTVSTVLVTSCQVYGGCERELSTNSYIPIFLLEPWHGSKSCLL